MNRDQERMNMEQQRMWGPFAVFIMMVQIFLRLATVSLEVFLHRNFGERFFSPIEFIAGVLALYVFVFFGWFLFAAEIAWLVLFGVAALLMGTYHLFVIYQRKGKGVTIHSRYWGDSLPFFYGMDLSHQTIQFYVEPALCFFVGIIFISISPLLGNWIMFGAIAWFFMCQLELRKWNNQILDAIDREIEARNFEAAVLEKKSPKETEGFFVPVSPNFTKAERATLADAFEGLDPKLKEMMGGTVGKRDDGDGDPEPDKPAPETEDTPDEKPPASS
jgi:hypothetical protein